MPDLFYIVELQILIIAIALITLLVIGRRRRRPTAHDSIRTMYALQEPTLCNAVFINGADVRRCILLVGSHGEHPGEHAYGVDPRLKLADEEKSILGRPRQEWPSE